MWYQGLPPLTPSQGRATGGVGALLTAAADEEENEQPPLAAAADDVAA
jgi:hypothetical protein